MKNKRGTLTITLHVIAVLLLIPLTTTGAAEQNSAISDAEQDICQYKFSAFPINLKEYEVYPWDLLKRQEFRAAYYKTLGEHRAKKWLQLSGPSGKSKHVVVNQQSLIMSKSCKQHQCDTHEIVILYAPDRKISYALLREDGRAVWLGNPSDCYKLAINKLIAW